MATTHPDPVRNAIADLVAARVDAGAGAGIIELQTAAGAEVATLTFDATAFGAAASGTVVANAIADDTSATGGVVAKYVVKDADGVEVFAGAVGLTGSDINLSSLNIAPSDQVSFTSFTYTAPV